MSPAPTPTLMPARSRTLLYLAWSLFALWISYLLILVLTTTRPIVLSRPQFLVSSLDVIAVLEGSSLAETTVKVQEVHWPKTEFAKQLAGQLVPVTNLVDCVGWQGPGTYILPLMADGKGSYRVVPTPPSPGFEPVLTSEAGRPQIYRAMPATLQQLATIPKLPDGRLTGP